MRKRFRTNNYSIMEWRLGYALGQSLRKKKSISTFKSVFN